MSGVEDADCQRVSKASSPPLWAQVEHGSKSGGDLADAWRRVLRAEGEAANEGTLADDPQGRKTRRSVGSRGRSLGAAPGSTAGTLAWRAGGLAEAVRFGAFYRGKTVCEGHGLPETRQVSLALSEGSMPEGQRSEQQVSRIWILVL